MNPKLKTYIEDISKIYGVKIQFNHNPRGGAYWRGKIILGTKAPNRDIIDVFCHELAHYVNDIEGRYPVYHRVDAKKAIRRMGLKHFARYALDAEIFTDKVGRKLAKLWFPKHKYVVGYTKSQYDLGFFHGYYLPEA